MCNPVLNNVSLICKSEYVAMPDGVRLAVSTWLAEDDIKNVDKRPAVVMTTRYWRANAFQDDKPEFQGVYPSASYFFAHGYVLVVADARGSGASFGCREAEMSPREVDDIGDFINWVARQDWCDGRVATTGTSYLASTSLYSLVTAPTALKLAVCRAPDFDGYRHLLAPGGIVNLWFLQVWGETTAAQDNNDVSALFAGDYWPVPESGADNLLGVRPVDNDTDGVLLASAIEEHKANFNLTGKEETLTFIDNILYDHHRVLFDPIYQEKVEKSHIPMIIRCGWHDAGTQLGALSMFASFNCPMRVILGPWNHGGEFRADPFQIGDGNVAEAIPWYEVRALTVNSLDLIFKQNNAANHDEFINKEFGIVEYYTLGENRWKTTKQWPLPHTQIQRFYLAPEQQLSTCAPSSERGCDHYQVDPTTGTGLNNRWYAQTAAKPILFPDREEDDKKLLVYDTPPLENDIEITGHPVVHLLIRSTAADGQFFVYLETVDPDGRVRMLTEGQLRGLHRKVSDEAPPYKMFGPYHSLKEKDAQPLIPGEIAEITFDLFPISVLLKKGQHIRLAIAGADKDVFAPIEGCENPEVTIERNAKYSSYIDLPLV
jgi:predicted acyl esterase